TPGYPSDPPSSCQSPASSLTLATICSAVRVGPEGKLRGSSCPVARIFTLVPPTSTTRILHEATPILTVPRAQAGEHRHGRRQPPKRSISRSASGGPHVPAA